MQLFSVDPTIVLKKFKMFVLTAKSWKNNPQKLLRIPQIHSFSLTALTAQTAQTEEFMFQNVAYWPNIELGYLIVLGWIFRFFIRFFLFERNVDTNKSVWI